MVSQIDLMASFAAMLHEKLPPDEFTDSRDYFSTLIGKSDKSRNFIVEQPVGHGGLAIVKDGWKYITPRKGPALMQDVNIETGNSLEDQLYDLKDDIREEHNLSDKYPGKTAELKALLKKVEAESAP
jgi:arylsulfatase A-like enzyme